VGEEDARLTIHRYERQAGLGARVTLTHIEFVGRHLDEETRIWLATILKPVCELHTDQEVGVRPIGNHEMGVRPILADEKVSRWVIWILTVRV
jgi:hypothetical protein